jgi:hypothetical protein
MTAHDRMLQAKSPAKDHFEVRKIETTARADPPGGQNINKRIFKKYLTETQDAWKSYYNAAMTLTNRGTFDEEAERIEARYQVAVQEHQAYHDWYDGMETVLDNLELANNPPVEVGLNATQILHGIDTEIMTSQDNLKKQLDDIEASLNYGTAPVTRLRLKTLHTLAEDVVTTVQGPVSELYDQRIAEAPSKVEATTTAKVNFIGGIKARVNLLKMSILAKFPVDARSANVDPPRVQQVY